MLRMENYILSPAATYLIARGETLRIGTLEASNLDASLSETIMRVVH
jgi:hypothetical protein